MLHFTNTVSMQAEFGIRDSGFAEQIPGPRSSSANPEPRFHMGVSGRRLKSRITPAILGAAGVLFTLALLPLSSQRLAVQPLIVPLECPGGDCPLLRGAPQTAGMRSGFVRLKPGETVGWHTTENHEESLVVLRGRGEARIQGQPARPFRAPALVYIPPATRHNIANTGNELLEYVYVVAPATVAPYRTPSQD